MPKARQTCTECSLRRQKCDKRSPCGRCVKRGVADRCTREWDNEARKHVGARPTFPGGNNDFVPSSATINNHNAAPSSTRDGRILPYHSTEGGILANSRDSPLQQPDFGCLSNVRQRHHGSTQVSDSRLSLLQMLLPNVSQLWKLVTFHEKRLLWYHGCYHGPTFNSQLGSRIQKQGLRDLDVLLLEKNDLQWGALLFAIIAGSITCANPRLTSQWGFEADEVEVLSQQWHKACVECLELANFMLHHQLYAVQAISTLTMCAHTLGNSNQQYVFLGTALRIAQSLRLHRLSLENESINVSSSSVDREAVLRKEVGRRLWSQLCVQDWFSIPFAGVHSIHRRHFSTVKPAERDYLTMELMPGGEPTYVSYGNYLYEIAALIVELHESLLRCNTEYTRYEQVMRTDTRMRELATKERPRYFDVTVQIDPAWPWYIPWARRSLTICFAHKVIVIHRTYLGRSFKDSTFAYTRRTCIAAAKTILSEARQERHEDEPIIWIDQVSILQRPGPQC